MNRGLRIPDSELSHRKAQSMNSRLPTIALRLPTSQSRSCDAPNPKRKDHPHLRLHVENLPLEEPPQPLHVQDHELSQNGLHSQHAHVLPDIAKFEGEIAEAQAEVVRLEEVEVEESVGAGFAEAVQGCEQVGVCIGRGGDGAEVEQAEGVGC